MTPFSRPWKKLGPVLTHDHIPTHFETGSICTPCVFRRPSWLTAYSTEWVMFFAHHHGQEIRVATAHDLVGPWAVHHTPLFSLIDLPASLRQHADHMGSPEVRLFESYLDVYYHIPFATEQHTFLATTEDCEKFDFTTTPVGSFYFRIVPGSNESIALAKLRNEGGIIYQRSGLSWDVYKRILPAMRHCCFVELQGELWLLWSQIGDCPESILAAPFSLLTCDVTDTQTIVSPTEPWERPREVDSPSKPGIAVGVNEIRDPFAVVHDHTLYLYYSYGGELGIALATLPVS